MTTDEIIAAREAFIERGFWPNEVMWECWKDAWLAGVEAERERCAKVCENGVDTEHPTVKGHIMKNFGVSSHLAAAIRKGE